MCIDKTVLAVEQNKVLIPPSYNKYLAWGFADHSLRIGHYDNDKVVLISEATGDSSGEVVACVCPSPKLIVTAGTCSVSKNIIRIQIQAMNLGHLVVVFLFEDCVTC